MPRSPYIEARLQPVAMRPPAPGQYAGEALAKEIVEAAGSFKHFLKTDVYIAERNPQGDVTGVIKWQWWPRVHDPMVRDLDQEQRLIILKARQLGISWMLAAWMVHGAMFNLNFLGGVVSAGELEAQEFIWKCRFVLEHLPWAPPPTLKTDNALELECTASGGRILGYPSTPKAGRGYTFSRWVTDEAAFHQFASRNYAAYGGATDGPIVIVSSAGDDERKATTDWFQRMWLGARDGINRYVARFYPPSVRPGRDEAWMRAKEAEMSATPGQFSREYPLTPEAAFRSMLLLRFDPAVVDENYKYALMARPLTSIEDMPERLMACPHLRVWAQPSPGLAYAVGIDGAEGKGLDFTVTVVYEVRTLRHVATLRENVLEPSEHGELAAMLAKWYNNAWCMVERSHGEAILMQLALAGCRIYKHHEEPSDLQRAKGAQPKETPGMPVTATTRPGLLDDLAMAVKDRRLSSPDPVFWGECAVFVVTERGRPEAAMGQHDDTIMATSLVVRMAGQPGVSLAQVVTRGARTAVYHEANPAMRREGPRRARMVGGYG